MPTLHNSSLLVCTTLLSILAVTPARAQAKSADGKIVTSQSIAQTPEEPDVKASTASVDRGVTVRRM